MSDEQLEEITLRYRLIRLMLNGSGPKAALEHLGIERTTRWAHALRKRYEEEGAKGLLDGRWSNGAEVTVLTHPVTQVILKWWYGRPAAGPRTVWKLVRDECREKDLPVPTYDAVKKYLAEIPVPHQLARAGRLRRWAQQGQPVVRYNPSQYSNHRHQADHTEMDIWIRVWRGGQWVPVKAWLTVQIDEFSRSVAGLVVSTKNPDRWTVSLLMMNAVKSKEDPRWKNRGLPETIEIDNGADLVSHSATAVFARLGVDVVVDPPHYPNNKGKVERFFRTLDTSCLRGLPGHTAAVGKSETSAWKHVELLLTRRQLQQEIEHWIVEDYHQRTHQETERKPAELWEETVRLRMYEDESEFHAMLLVSDQERVVRNTGVDFQGGRYWAPHLTDWFSQPVRVRYNPEDLESVLLYSTVTGEFICEAWIMGQPDSKYTVEHVKRERRQYRLGLQERLREYQEETREHDRRVAREDWTEAREKAAQLEELEAELAAEDDDIDEVARLMEEIERLERGESGMEDGEGADR